MIRHHRWAAGPAAVAATLALAALPGCAKDATESTTGTITGGSVAATVGTTPGSRVIGTTTAVPGSSTTSASVPGSSAATSPSTASSTTRTTASGPTTTRTTPPDGDGGKTLAGADTSDKSAASTATGTVLYDDLRHAAHDGFHRVVFDFRNGTPGWSVRYVNKPILSDGAGEEVAVSGNFVLQVRMEPASGVDMEATADAGEVVMTYTGPKRIAVNGKAVTELVESGDFEAVVHWNIGTKAKVPFKVSTLQNPSRLVIDIADS